MNPEAVLQPQDAAGDTPMMRQYRALKAKHPQDILFFRLGDFYEMFEEDAKEASRLLGLTLTSRAKGDGAVPMAGVPAHAAEAYLRRLLAAGRRVAICEQTDDRAGGMMRREVVRVVTPGTVTEEGMLQAKVNTWLAAAHPGPGGVMGLAWADCSTGEFRVAELADYARTRDFPIHGRAGLASGYRLQALLAGPCRRHSTASWPTASRPIWLRPTARSCNG